MAANSTWFLFLVAAVLIVSASAGTQIKVTNNPADKLVDIINSNRTAHKASSLYDNQGLACIALQYIKAYQGDCDAVGGPDAKKPPDSAFAETFAPNCGVQTSTLAPITGRLIGCQSKYVHADEAFSKILIENSKALDILYDKNHTEVGAAASGSDGGAPYFWCVLFSSGKTNSTFVTEGGEAKITRPGCFSGANDDCSESNHPASGADDWSRSSRLWPFFTAALVAMSCAFGLFHDHVFFMTKAGFVFYLILGTLLICCNLSFVYRIRCL